MKQAKNVWLSVLGFALMGASWAVILPMEVAYLFVHGYAIYFRVKFDKEM